MLYFTLLITAPNTVYLGVQPPGTKRATSGNPRFICRFFFLHHFLMRFMDLHPISPQKNSSLVAGFSTPPKKIRKSVGMTIPNIWKDKIDVPNHQIWFPSILGRFIVSRRGPGLRRAVMWSHLLVSRLGPWHNRHFSMFSLFQDTLRDVKSVIQKVLNISYVFVHDISYMIYHL